MRNWLSECTPGWDKNNRHLKEKAGTSGQISSAAVKRGKMKYQSLTVTTNTYTQTYVYTHTPHTSTNTCPYPCTYSHAYANTCDMCEHFRLLNFCAYTYYFLPCAFFGFNLILFFQFPKAMRLFIFSNPMGYLEVHYLVSKCVESFL